MALIPPWFLDCVVAIGVSAGENQRKWVASGFLYGRFLNQESETKSYYEVFLVTNRHVLAGKDVVYARFNPLEGERAHEFDLPLFENGKQLWATPDDPEIDVAVVQINPGVLREHKAKFSYFHNNRDVADCRKMQEEGVTEGDRVFVLGFPMGQVGGDQNFVIVRGGTIARVRDVLQGAGTQFLVDAFVFPGNSGGPVVLQPEVVSIEGTSSRSQVYLVGIVTGYLPYHDVAISQQTGKARVIFEENSGLVAVHPVDYIEEAIQKSVVQRGIS